MALNRSMSIGPADDSAPDSEHTTVYQASRGGSFPQEDKPVPGAPRGGEPREAR